MATDDIQNLLKAGISAAKAGNKLAARKLLEKVLEQDDGNETAWMWFATVVETPREKRICLENVLEINPNNQRAREALEKLGPLPSTEPAPEPTRGYSPSPASAYTTPTSSYSPPPSNASARPSAPRSAGTSTAAPIRRRRRIFSPIFLVGGVVGILLIFVGVFLLLNTSNTPAVAPTVAATTVAQMTAPVETPSSSSGSNGANNTAPTIPPIATIVTAIPSTPLPTFTPSPSFTPSTIIPPTATLPPVGNYTLLFVGEGRPNNTHGIFQIKGDGTNEHELVTGPDAYLDVAVSNDNRIAFISTSEGLGKVFVGTADGKNVKSITSMTGKYIGQPAWSSDGRYIAFVSDEPGNKEIYMVDSDGQNLKRLTNNKVDDVDPAWSPKGDELAYASDPTGRKVMQILILTLSTDETRQLTNANSSSYSPAWSPDGNYMAFVSTRDRYEDVYVTDTNEGTQTHLLTFNDGEAINRYPSWSPDGRYIVFSSNRGTKDGKTFNIYLITPDAKTLLPVTKDTTGQLNSYGARFKPGL